MLNKYPLWKNLVIVFALVIGFIYALPNFFPDDYAIQITGARGSTEVEQRVLDRALAKLEQEGIEVKSSLLEERDALIRKVLPALNKALAPRYVQIVPVDLRWGVSADKSTADTIQKTCLNEVDRCRVEPDEMPWFLGLRCVYVCVCVMGDGGSQRSERLL